MRGKRDFFNDLSELLIVSVKLCGLYIGDGIKVIKDFIDIGRENSEKIEREIWNGGETFGSGNGYTIDDDESTPTPMDDDVNIIYDGIMGEMEND